MDGGGACTVVARCASEASVILHVDTGLEWRGGQTQLLHLARAQGTRCVVALRQGAPLGPALAEAGVPVAWLPCGGRLGVWAGAPALARLVRRLRPALIAAHTSHAHSLAWSMGLGPLVVHRRVDFAPGRFSSPKYRGVRGYVAVSQAVKQVLIASGVSPERIRVVHDGVDVAPVGAPRAYTRPTIGCVGALVPHKDHATFLRAMRIVTQRRPDVGAVILGEGPLRGPLTDQIQQMSLTSQVELLGYRPDIRRYLAGLRVFCHPSVEEGMGQVVVEALLAGVPIVATRAGGVAEVLEEGRWGQLVPARDPQALAEALIQALDVDEGHDPEPGKAWAMGRFGVSQMVHETEVAYRSLVAGVTC